MVDYTQLIAAARAAHARAYAPYSGFNVGAALLTTDGRIYQGCNIENAAYPVCLCAERAALGAAWSAGERSFAALAVIADTERPVPPCGMCRQFLLELMPDTPVVLANLRGDQLVTSPRELLPDGFAPADLLDKPKA